MSLVNFGSSISSIQTSVIDPARLSVEQKISQLPGLDGSFGSFSPLSGDMSIPTMRITPDITGQLSATIANSIPFSATSSDGSAAGNSSSGGDKVTFKPLSNPLNDFDQATYSIRFSILGDEPNSTREVVIAETGKTNLNIESMVITSMPSPSVTNRSAPSSSIEMKIFEPYGANLPDSLIAAAKSLASHNYMKGPWKITVKFQGYDPITGKPNQILNRDWSWTVSLVELKTRVNESGSTHTMSFIPMSNVGYYDQFVKFPEAFSVPLEEGQTIGQILNGVIDRMNGLMAAKYGGPYVTYSIDQIPYAHPTGGIANPFDHKLDSSNPLFKSLRSSGVQVSGGSALMSLIDNLFAASPTAAKMANSASRDPNNNPNTYVDVVSTFHTVQSEVTIVDYNEKVDDYNRKIKYIIHPYETVRMITNNQQQQEINDPAKNQTKANFIVQNNYLSKMYDYIFTGKNTDVLKFDIDLNFQWCMVADNDFGARHYGSETVARAANPQQIASSNSSTPTEMQGGPETTTFNGSEPPYSQSFAPQPATPQPPTETTNPSRQSTENKLSQSPNSITYVDDLNFTSADNFNIHKVTINQQSNTNRTQTSSFVDNDFTKQRSVYGMLLNQLYDGGGSQTSFLSIQIDIRGDPYWLGSDQSDNQQIRIGGAPSGSSPNASSQSGANRSQASNYPSFLNGEYVFVLRFNLPQGFDEATGNAKIVQSEMYTGFYNCYQVQHNFKDGAYTQTLSATRILGMDVNKLLNIVYGK